ncbi:MAG: DUF4153 domain-containing protein [Chitinophagia bacterium]|nr:DUF4153 domain-containing protein [Chitinophagia bacterium]
MKFLSLDVILRQAAAAFKRFPITIVLAWIATLAQVSMTAESAEMEGSWYPDIFQGCLLGLPLSLGVYLFAERRKAALKWPLLLLVLGFCVAYIIWLSPGDFLSFWRLSWRVWLFAVLLIAGHIWVAIAPYMGQTEPLGFWRFNQTMLARLLQSALFSAVLIVGINLAILALDVLFKANIDYKTYAYVLEVILGTFSVWYFAAGVPADFQEINTPAPFPKSLKIFSQYILIPLVMLYGAILYAYGAKILVTWQLPRGWVSLLIMWYEVLGMLAILLVTPLRDSDEHPWIKRFTRYFFRASLPLLVLLYVAVGVRVGNYGITESRYYLLVLGLWAGGIALYFLLSKVKNIKVLPLTLVMIAVVSLLGPWNAFNVSKQSQLSRLRHALARNGYLDARGLSDTAKGKPLNDWEMVNMRDIVGYLVNNECVEDLQRLSSYQLPQMTNVHGHQGRIKKNRIYRSYDYYTGTIDTTDKITALLFGTRSIKSAASLALQQDSEDNSATVDRTQNSAHVPVDGFATITNFHAGCYSHSDAANDSSEVWWVQRAKNDSVSCQLVRHQSAYFLKYVKGTKVTSLNITPFLDKIVAIPADSIQQRDMILDTAGVRLVLTLAHRSMPTGPKPLQFLQITGWMMIK